MTIDVELQRTRRYAFAVALSTLAWLVAVPVSVWFWFVSALGPGHQRHSDWLLLLLLAGIVAGPALIAAVALAGRLVGTGIVYLVLAVLLTLPAGFFAEDAYRRLFPPDPPPPAGPVGCQEHSGGDTTCPGG